MIEDVALLTREVTVAPTAGSTYIFGQRSKDQTMLPFLTVLMNNTRTQQSNAAICYTAIKSCMYGCIYTHGRSTALTCMLES